MNFSKNFKIGRKEIGRGKPTYIIAEIGSNHNQNLNLAIEMIEQAADAGANAVKFQSILFNKLYQKEYESKKFYDWFKSIELNEKWYPILIKHAKKNNLEFLSSPTYSGAIDLFNKYNLKAIKIASPQFQGDHEIVKKAALTGKPLILSTGYALEKEIKFIKDLCFKYKNRKLVFLHCVSKYPTAYKETNLIFLNKLKQLTGCLVGFSDHSQGYHLPIAAVTLGASIIEKHVTKNRNSKGPDHHFAMHFNEFKEMVLRIREVESAFGDSIKSSLPKVVKNYKNNIIKKAFSNKLIKKNEIIENKNLKWLRCSKKGIDRNMNYFSNKIIIANKNIKPNTLITIKDVIINKNK